MSTEESCQKDLKSFIKEFFEKGLKRGETHQLRKGKRQIITELETYCRQQNLDQFYRAVEKSTNMNTTGERLEKIILEIVHRDLSPEQLTKFKTDFTFYTQRIGVVDTDSYHLDMEWLMDGKIDLASGEFKEGRGAFGCEARRRLRTQKKYGEIIDKLNLEERTAFRTSVAKYEREIEDARYQTKERKIRQLGQERRLARLRESQLLADDEIA